MTTNMKYTGSIDNTSSKTEFIIAPYTANGPADPHSNIPAPGASAANTTLRFPGKGLVDYGELVCNSMLYMLEHFAASRPPEFPTSGQLWYDLLTGYMRVWTDTEWQPTHILLSDVDPVPSSPVTAPHQYIPLPEGTLWMNTATGEVNRRAGASWVGITSNYLQLTGGVMGGDISMGTTHTVTNLREPTAPSDAATKLYIDNNTATLVTSSHMWPIANVIDLQTELDGLHADVDALQVNVANNTSDISTLQTDVTDKVSSTSGVITGTVDVQGLLSVNAAGALRVNAPVLVPTDVATKAYVDAAASGGSTVAGLNDLTDVTVGTLAPQDLLIFSAGTGQWVNLPASVLNLAPLSHTTQVTGAHAASAVSFAPPVGMVSANTQDAIVSLYNTKISQAGGSMTGPLMMNGNQLGGLALPSTGNDAANRTYVDRITANPRRLQVVSAADTLMTPTVRPGTGGIVVYLNGVKQYQTSVPHHTMDLDHSVSDLSASTGVPNDDTVYTANVTSTTVHQLVGVSGVNISVVGNMANWYSAGTALSISESTGNDGSYTVATAGATYSSTTRLTTIPLTTTPPSAIVDGLVTVTAKVRPLAIRGKLIQTYTGLITNMVTLQEAIQDIDATNSTISITGDYTGLFVAGYKFSVTGTGAALDDGNYVTVSSAYTSGNTVITTTVAPATTVSAVGWLQGPSAVEFGLDVTDYNIRLVGSGVGGSTASVVYTGTGANPLTTVLSAYVGMQTPVPGVTGAYIEDLTSRFRNRDDQTVIDRILCTSPITGTVEIYALTPSI